MKKIITCSEIIAKRKELWEENKDIELDEKFTEAAASMLVHKKNGEKLREEITRYPERLIEMFFVIVNKEQMTVPFFLNDVQQMFLNILNNALDEFKEGKRHHLKFLILKGRQQGFTSIITAYQEACTITRKNFSGFTVADNSDNTNTIFEDKAKYPYSQLPEAIKPVEKYNTRREMIFENLNSKWRCATAGNKDIGRSKTINFFHGSEAAFWDSIGSIIGGLGQALTNGSIQILESTANGFNEFRTLWEEAENKENNWQPLFFEWWQTPEYKTEFENEKAEKEFKEFVKLQANELSKKLYYLLDFHKLKWEQIYWYYGKAKDLKELLAQEYPCNSLESFLASGHPIFNNELILKRIEYLTKKYKGNHYKIGKFIYDYENQMIVDSSIKFVEDSNGYIKIYEQPKENYPYVIGGDTAEGGEDYCIGQVLNNVTGKQVATWRSRMDTDLYAKQMYCLGKYYNEALLSIEMNFDLHPVKELQRLEYPKQYLRETMDSVTGDIQYKFGFNTNRATKPVIIGNLVEIAREETHLINDIDTLKEMLTFVNNDGKYEAAEGEHDDLVMALAIAYKSRSQQDYTPKIKEKEKAKMFWALESEENSKGEFIEW